jgi:hypothetical protein
MEEPINKIIKRHTLEINGESYVSVDLINLIFSNIKISENPLLDSKENRPGYINVHNLPLDLRNECLQVLPAKILELKEPALNEKDKNNEVSGEMVSRIEGYLIQDIAKYPKYLDYFRDIFVDDDLAIQKAKSVCVHKHLISKINDGAYLKIAYGYLKANFPDCELLTDSLRSFRGNLISYKRAGLLNALIESSL